MKKWHQGFENTLRRRSLSLKQFVSSPQRLTGGRPRRGPLRRGHFLPVASVHDPLTVRR